ncbi:MAG: aminotransferase class V-fold PLP-dependent enzyme [Chloroflexi bacterium]|nr:aminotransferase class V-fold PLP-dependent enzyme [Chloroflexota bacterium]
MTIYAQLGLEPVINAAGTSTRVGGPLMHPRAAAAMAEAASSCVPLDRLEAAASDIIAELTGAEAGYVTAGAAAGLTLAAAACLAGLDIGVMDRLPDTSGLPNEIVVCREQRNGYDHALRAAGARLVDVGMNERVAGAGVRRTEAWEIESAISEHTVAVAYFATPDSAPPLEEVAEVCRRHGAALIVDAAAQLPPAANLRYFIAAGADLVTFSGGKGLRGPQSTGILAGRRDLIMSAALQHLDLDEHWSTWEPPANLIDRTQLRGFPRHGIGRGFKVAREEIVALLVALRCFAAGDYHADIARFGDYLRTIADGLADLPHVTTNMVGGVEEDRFPHLEVSLNQSRDAFAINRRLKNGSPAVYINESRLHEGTLVVHAIGLEERLIQPLIARLRAELAG